VIRLGEGDIKSTMTFIQDEWEKQLPGIIFDYQFLDEAFDRLYKNERRIARMFSGFSILAIIIACLGLFGLSTYETQMRTKEIGIRKALGSTSLGIFRLLIRNFAVLILISFILSIPISYILMERWLESFANRISIDMGVFIISGILTFLIVFFSVGYRSIVASLKNPVTSLRYE
jgi:putative ABC transport system permease protein